MKFNENEWQRYQRHIQLPNFGQAGQSKLKEAKVLIVGAGGLGCPASQYLAAAGVGNITLVDGDEISRSNLQRQILFGEDDIGKYKAEIIASKLSNNNPNIEITPVLELLSTSNAESLINNSDIVIDCTDNFASRYLINDTCVNSKKPWIYASVVQYSGQIALFTPETACFRCIFPEAPNDDFDCNSAGVLSTLPGVMALYQANEALKYLAGLETPLKNQLMLIEGLGLETRKIQLKKNSSCLCDQGHIDIDQNQYQFRCTTTENSTWELDRNKFQEKKQLENAVLVDVRSTDEHTGYNLGGENIPYDNDFLENFSLRYPNKEQIYLLYCQSGKRSTKATEELIDNNYLNVYSLRKGLE